MLTKLIASFSFFLALQAQAQIKFQKNKKWKEILSAAKAQNKLIFLDAYATWCGLCKYLQNNVFTQTSVGNYFNKNFINVKMDMEVGEGVKLAETLGVSSYPTLFFINGKGEVVHKFIGAMEAKEFVSLGKDAVNPQKQFYTLKKKLIDGTAVPAMAHEWIHTAKEMEEETDGAVMAYLSKINFRTEDKDVIEILLDHAPALTEEQLNYLLIEKQKLVNITNLSQEKFDAALVKAAIKFSAEKAYQNDQMDFAVFKTALQKYSPQRAALETQKMKVKYYDGKEDYSKAVDELLICITDTALKLDVKGLATLVLDYLNPIINTGRTGEVLAKLTTYQLLPSDNANWYFKDVALLVLYLNDYNETKTRQLTDKLLHADDVPEKVKQTVNNLLEGR